MSSTTDKIKHAANRNRKLVTILSETDHAHSELEQQDRYISDLNTGITQSRKEVAELDSKRKKELKEHASYRDSVMKRFAYKAVGKKEDFEAKAKKEEKEYFEALQEEHKTQQLLKNQEEALEEAQTARQEMVGKCQRHDQAQRDMDALYEEVFQGPSPGFPEEDAAEERRRGAGEDCRNMRSRAEAQAQAVRCMENAMAKMIGAYRSMQTALNHSRRDMWGGGTLTDMMERNALSKAEVLSTEARLAVSQAQQFDGQIQALPQVQVPTGDILTDVFFDNIFTDMMFHDKIKQGMVEMEHARGILERMLGQARTRAGQLEGEVAKRQSALENARLELQKIREQEFERVAGSGGNDAAALPSSGSTGTGLGSNNPFRQTVNE
ncbi:hypothetical protein MKZ38_009483 [Zalerion maritima]|uniref:Uncharacterized protein n=1 Tax=Zalerion maritima TaxID=339359 RepID=A0AAD5WM99_9PEZI|nr:hypothetical protein MKZ38_009483 [Zalerion maritima]